MSPLQPPESKKVLQGHLEVRERLGDFTPTTGRRGERQIIETKRGSEIQWVECVCYTSRGPEFESPEVNIKLGVVLCL